MIDRVADYGNKLRVLRQIMSNKARSYARINNVVNIGTVIVSSLLTFIGFAGISKVQGYLQPLANVPESTVELVVSVLALSLFVLVILHLVFRFGSRQAEAERAIVLLTQLINQVDDVLARVEAGYAIALTDIDVVRQKYDALIQVIPSNSDQEYLRARKDVRAKEERKAELQLSSREVFDKDAQRRTLVALVRQSPTMMRLLEALRTVDDGLYLGGGLVRNTVWDYLHGYPSATPIEDVDVVYFDRVSSSKEHDLRIEARLHELIPNVQWEVKNQARMHVVNADAAYTSLDDAIRKWPETATAIATRLKPDGDVEIISPYGLDDLFRLIVAPTPHFNAKIEKYRARLQQKAWGRRWPKLRVFDDATITEDLSSERLTNA